MNTSRKAIPILSILNSFNVHFQKLYCYPSQKTILERLAKSAKLVLSKRQLNYDLAAMVADGYLRRIRRHRVTKHRGMEFRSTLYEITKKGYHLLAGMCVISWGMFKRIKEQINGALTKHERPAPRRGARSELVPLGDVVGDMLAGVH